MKVKAGQVILKEQILNEDFNSQQELEKLTVDIFKTYLMDLVSEKNFILRQFRYPRLWLFNTLKTKNTYHTLTDFMENFKMFFQFENKIEGRHAYFSAESLKMGVIGVEVDMHKTVEALKKLNPQESKEEQMKDLYYALYDNNLLSGILHELQHAYDHYRSKGKFIDSNKKSKSYYKRVKNDSPVGDERTNYLRLQHEVESRFAQAINLTVASGEPWGYIKDFTQNFEGWNKMTPKIKKYLMRRASQYYYKKLEQNKNKGGE